MKPKIAIVILCRDNSNSIEKAFYSVANQDYPNKEIIIIDNASTDDSWQKICQLQQTHNIQTLRNEFESTLLECFVSGIGKSWKESNIFGLLQGGHEYLPNKLSVSIDYTGNMFDKIGILYSDYQTVINNHFINMYRQSFKSGVKIDFGKNILITKHSLEKNINPEDDFNDFLLKTTNRFAAIHIPEILTREI